MTRQERWKRIGDGRAYNRLLRLRGSEDKFLDSDIAWMEGLPASDNGESYYYAGTLPEVVIKPRKDNAVYKMNYMIPNKKLRQSFYDDLDLYEDLDSRTYINRLWNLYNKAQKPTIKSVKSASNIFSFYDKITGGDGTRANYNPIINAIYIDPEYAVEDIEAELSHAYQFYGTDAPRSYGWSSIFSSLPGDIKINGKSGYRRYGNQEFNAHSIIEPMFNAYLTDETVNYDDAKSLIDDMLNPANKNFYFPEIKRGPYLNWQKQLQPLKK